MITVIGATNIDIMATALAAMKLEESNRSHIDVGIGGSGKNIAHNLRLLGEKIQFITLFGNDYFGDLCRQECQRLGIDTRLSATPKEGKCSMFLCINTPEGEMKAAASEMSIMEGMTREFLSKRIDAINKSKAVVVESSLPADSIAYLMDNCLVPIFAHTTDVQTAPVIYEALHKALTPHLMGLCINEAAAANLFSTSEYKDEKDPDAIAAILADLGVRSTYITRSSEGVYAQSNSLSPKGLTFPSLPVEQIVNSNGAGDAFSAGIVYAHLQQVPFPDCVHFGLHAANATLQVGSMVNPNLAEIFAPLTTHTGTFLTQDNRLVTMQIEGAEPHPF